MMVEISSFKLRSGLVDEWIGRIPEWLELYFPREEATSYRILQSLEDPLTIIFEVIWTTSSAHKEFEHSEKAAEIHRRFDKYSTADGFTLDYFAI
jgi:hypothetical protein